VYDFENYLISANKITYTYDGHVHRISKTANDTTITFATSDINPAGYSQALQERLELRQHYGNSGNNRTQTMYFAHDGHGSVRAVTDQNGAVTDTYDYDAFGVLIHQTGSTPYTTLYSGEQFDPDLGLYFNRARYLNTSTGRFWNMDSFEGDENDPLSLHKYLYASSDPVNRIDPLGHEDADVSSNLVSAAGQAILATIALVSAIAAVCTVDYQLGRDDCIDHGKNRIDLFHYTALPNVQKIRDSGQLWPSLLSAGDAYFGEGQYFTDISPTDASTRTKGQLAFAVYSDPRKWWNSEVGYLRFNLSQASVKRVRSVYGPSFPGKGILSVRGLPVSRSCKIERARGRTTLGLDDELEAAVNRGMIQLESSRSAKRMQPDNLIAVRPAP
jgi:RHS repeat-associated protein